jgi:PKD repeat protein
MWATLASNVCGRNNLNTPGNLAATGADGGSYVCAPTALFGTCDLSSQKYICEGGSILLKDQSMNIDTTGVTISWFSPGANPSTVTGSQVSLTFPTAGTYDVSLTVTNSTGSDVYTATNYVVVTSGALATATPIVEGFETIAIPGAAGWFIDNESPSSNTFQTSALTAFTGANSLRLQNHSGNTSGTKDAIISPSFSLANTTATKAYFRVAYANRATGSGDILKGFVSDDCGATWIQRYVKTASQLQTVPTIVTTSFAPISGSIDTTQWRQDFINLGSFSNSPNVRIKFEFTFDTGNNLYIDDINIFGTTVGINDINMVADEMTLAPNPTNGSTRLNFKMINSNDVVITITDVLGKQLDQLSKGSLTPGDYSYTINTPWSKGVYFVQVVSGNQLVTKKLIIQ